MSEHYAIQRPTQYRPIPDELYEEVATVYQQATADGYHQPCKLIAEASGHPLGTVHRWVATARKRGLLPPATPGKASGVTPMCRTCGRPL